MQATVMIDERSPSLANSLRKAIESQTQDVHVCFPGRVQAYDSKEQKADIQPLINRLTVRADGTELTEQFPEFPDVPIRFARSAGFFLTFPIKVGDFVTVHIMDRSIDKWIKSEGEISNPDDSKSHDLSDAFAVPGLYPFSKSIQDIDTEAMAFGSDNGGKQIHIHEDKVEITYQDGNTLTLENQGSGTKATFGDGAKSVAIAERLESLWGLMVTFLKTHVHPTAMGPSGTPPNPPPDWDPTINSTKMKIPDL